MNIFEILNEKYTLPKKPKLFEAFAGIGCQRLAFNRLGIEVDMVGISEIDKYAIQSYMAIHGDTKNFGSICDIQTLPEVDVFTWSFPCTDLSKAGKQKGLTNTRSGLVYEVLRILHNTEHKPKVLIMENVVDLVQTKFIREFQTIQHELELMGYTNYTETMNAKDYGVAQNRDRVFMVSILGEYYYEFPKPFPLEKRLKDYLEESVDEKYYLSENAVRGLNRANEREHTPTWLNEESEEAPCIDTRVGALTHWPPYIKENGSYLQWDNTGKEHDSQAWRAYFTDGSMCTISASNSHGDKTQIVEPIICASRGRNADNPKSRESGLDMIQMIEPKYDGIANTLTTVQKDNLVIEPFIEVESLTRKVKAYEGDGVIASRPHQTFSPVVHGTSHCIRAGNASDSGVVQNLRIRKLTSLECWRLMGIDDKDFRAAEKVCSNSQLYKQAGNGIVVEVFMQIIDKMKNDNRIKKCVGSIVVRGKPDQPVYIEICKNCSKQECICEKEKT